MPTISSDLSSAGSSSHRTTVSSELLFDDLEGISSKSHSIIGLKASMEWFQQDIMEREAIINANEACLHTAKAQLQKLAGRLENAKAKLKSM
jgi:hypothetical protein